jgi:glycosyltransferase involved in cell wall biosynthesis
MKRLVIDVNSTVHYLVTGRLNGVGRTTLGLLNSFSKIRDELPFHITLFSQNIKGTGGRDLSGSFRSRHLFLPYRNWITKPMKFLPVREAIMPYDLIHVPHNFEYVYNPEKTLLTLHDTIFMHINEMAFDHLRLRKEVPKLAGKCKGIVTCSVATREDIIKTMNIDPGKISVIYWGVDIDIFHPVEQKEEVKIFVSKQFSLNNPYFISVSCSSERKNTHLLIDAYLLLLKQNPLNDLVLVWNNPPGNILQKVEKEDFDKRIHFLKHVSDSSLAYLYNGATSLFFPSSYEGFGLPVLESMSCGTPVVTCNNSSLPEVGGDAALYMNEPTVKNILFYLEAFENANYDLNLLSEKCLNQAQKFTWEKTARQYVDFYSRNLGIS